MATKQEMIKAVKNHIYMWKEMKKNDYRYEQEFFESINVEYKDRPFAQCYLCQIWHYDCIDRIRERFYISDPKCPLGTRTLCCSLNYNGNPYDIWKWHTIAVEERAKQCDRMINAGYRWLKMMGVE